ncbi:MAG: DUF1080 domain-containing protein [Bacteroidales bacterium]
MRKSICLITLTISTLMLFNACEREQQWEQIFNGEDLSNWDMYLGSSLGPDFDSLATAATIDKVFSVVEDNGEKVIRISGEINGSLSTRESFEDYHLRLVFKWGDEVYSRRNSGLLYHSFGDFGAAFGTWMPNIEFQMMHQNLGDTYLMVNTTCDTEAVMDQERNQFVYTPGAEMLTFGEHANGRSIKKSSDNENPLGDWNTLDLYCFGRIAVHIVNGRTVMVNTNTGTYEDGEISPLSSGRIQIQSEGGELFVRTVQVKPIIGIPKEFLP